MMEKDRKQILSALTNALLVEKAIQNQLLGVSEDLMDDQHINSVYKISITRMNMIKAEMRAIETPKKTTRVSTGYQSIQPPRHHMVIEHA